MSQLELIDSIYTLSQNVTQSLSVIRCKFIECGNYNVLGGGVCIIGASYISRVVDSTFIDCKANTGGVGYFVAINKAEFARNCFVGCSCQRLGGSVYTATTNTMDYNLSVASYSFSISQTNEMTLLLSSDALVRNSNFSKPYKWQYDAMFLIGHKSSRGVPVTRYLHCEGGRSFQSLLGYRAVDPTNAVFRNCECNVINNSDIRTCIIELQNNKDYSFENSVVQKTEAMLTVSKRYDFEGGRLLIKGSIFDTKITASGSTFTLDEETLVKTTGLLSFELFSNEVCFIPSDGFTSSFTSSLKALHSILVVPLFDVNH